MNEFSIIKHYFATQISHRADVVVGIGDDAAIVKIPADHELVVTTDTLVANAHFPASTLPYDIGYKSLAVNLSDLAAMGATPAWVIMAITLPEANDQWLQAFCDGFFTLANRAQVQLIGGDVTRGPLSITVQAMGVIPAGKALLRSGAQPNDLVYVSGTLGDAGVALEFLQKRIQLDPAHQQRMLERLHRPEPRIATGEHLRNIATAAIDVSDGLAADLSHILEASHVGAIIYVDQLPLSEELKHAVSQDEAIALALNAGDDYELCFTIPLTKRSQIEKSLSSIPCRFTCIGEITAQSGIDLRYQNGNKYHGSLLGYQHF